LSSFGASRVGVLHSAGLWSGCPHPRLIQPPRPSGEQACPFLVSDARRLPYRSPFQPPVASWTVISQRPPAHRGDIPSMLPAQWPWLSLSPLRLSMASNSPVDLRDPCLFPFPANFRIFDPPLSYQGHFPRHLTECFLVRVEYLEKAPLFQVIFLC